MAKIIYSPSVVDNPDVQTPRQIPDVYQRIQTDTGQFGGLIGAAETQAGARLEQASNELADTGFKIQNFKNTTDSNSATQQYVDAVNKFFHGDGTDANPGLFNLKGREALDALPNAMTQMKQVFADAGNTLSNPAARKMYESDTRRYLMAHEDQLFRFGQAAQKEYAENQNQSMIASAHTSSTLNYNNDSIADADIDRATNGLVQNYQLKYGNATDETRANLKQEAITQNMQNRMNGAIARGDFATAHAIGEKYGPQADPNKYREMNDLLNREEHEAKTRGLTDSGKDLGDQILQHWLNGGPAPVYKGPTGPSGQFNYKGGQAAPSAIHAAIYGTEGSGPEAVSVNGARGKAQIIESTFNANKREGESFDNEQDRMAVSGRLIDDYTQRYNGDPARVAVAYFSGPGNVAPPDSPTPWIADKKDGNGASTSGYVKSVLGRLGGSGSSTPKEEGQPTETDQGNVVAILGQNGKSYELTNEQADKYYGIKDFRTQQKFLETLEPKTQNAPAGAGSDEVKGAPDTVKDEVVPQPKQAAGNLTPFPSREQMINMIPPNAPIEVRHAAMARINQAFEEMNARSYEERRKMERWIPGVAAKLADGQFDNSTAYDPATIRHYLTPDAADKAIDMLDQAKQVGTYAAQIRTMNPVQIQDVSDKLHHELESNQNPDLYLKNKTIVENFDKAAHLQLQQLTGKDADPAGFLRRIDPVLDQKAKALDPKNPQSVDDYVTAMGARQTQMGVPKAMQHIVTTQQSLDMARSIMADPSKSADVLQGMKQQWGDHWNDVFADAVTLGKLPAAYQMVQHLQEVGNPHDAALLARAMGGAQKETGEKAKEFWEDTIGTKEMGNIKTSLLGNPTLQNFVHSLMDSNAPQPQIDSLFQSVHTLAYAKELYDKSGNPADDAVKSVAGKYDFLSEYGGPRVPSNVADTVRTNVAITMDRLAPDAVVVPKLTNGVTPEQWMAMLKAKPHWVTTQREDAIQLLDQGGRLVMGKDNKPIEIPFAAPAMGPPPIMVSPPYNGP